MVLAACDPTVSVPHGSLGHFTPAAVAAAPPAPEALLSQLLLGCCHHRHHMPTSLPGVKAHWRMTLYLTIGYEQ